MEDLGLNDLPSQLVSQCLLGEVQLGTESCSQGTAVTCLFPEEVGDNSVETVPTWS